MEHAPSEREACICAMFDSFCVTVICNAGRNLKRATENRKKYDATGDEAVEYLIELLIHEDTYEADHSVFGGCTHPSACFQRGIKLIEQITAGRMNLHAVKSRLLCPDCGSGKIMIY